jgi:hypothetical protein
MNIQIAHEAPISIIRDVQAITDYDYCLVHLLEEQPEYLKFFKESKQKGRKVLLDNSIFELGEAFHADKFAQWVQELNPDEYIIPDSLENTDKTLFNALSWNNKYNTLPGKKIGVIQGKTYNDLKNCYKALDKEFNVDKIAISFDYSFYNNLIPHPNKLISWMLGRVALISMLRNDGIINESKPHHLLGASLPWEFTYYREGFEFIESLDTSSPVVSGIEGIMYSDMGIWEKPKTKLFTIIDKEVENLYYVNYNIQKFRHLVTLKHTNLKF